MNSKWNEFQWNLFHLEFIPFGIRNLALFDAMRMCYNECRLPKQKRKYRMARWRI